MRVLNRSSLPTAEIRALARRELGRARPGSVIVLDRPFGSSRQGHVRYTDRRVRVWIGGTTEYPYTSAYGSTRSSSSSEELAGFPRFTIRDWREDLVATAAHEALHLERMDPGDRAGELAAERYAAKRLELYRSRRRRSLLERIRELL